ncbi:hypothetical protein [Helicobacter sp. 23-1045]
MPLIFVKIKAQLYRESYKFAESRKNRRILIISQNLAKIAESRAGDFGRFCESSKIRRISLISQSFHNFTLTFCFGIFGALAFWNADFKKLQKSRKF